MSDLINKYPYTDFHAVNLDYILKVVRENAGLHLEVSGNQLLLKTADNTIISAITISYATEAGSANIAQSAAYASSAGSASSASYASTAGSAATATNATNAAHAATADTATSASTATSATSAASADYATSAGTAAEATHAASADYATTTENVAKAGNGLKAVTTSVQGNIIFTLESGGFVLSDIKKALSADKDASGNVINTTYIASVIDDNGTLKFKNANGAVIASITPSSQVADQDSYGNTIADYIKTIATAAGSNYVTVTHGNGTSDTILIPYSDSAWKDTNGNVIKNFYAGSMEIVEDEDTGHYNLVVYNGDTPKAELYRFEIYAYKAQEADHADEADHAANADHATTADSAAVASQTPNGDTIQEYAKTFVNDSTVGVQNFVIKDGDGNTLINLDLQKGANHFIMFEDQDPSNPLSPLSASFTVGHEEEYHITNLALWNWNDFRDHMTEIGLHFRYRDENQVTKFSTPPTYYCGHYLFNMFDTAANTFKVFSVLGGNSADTLIIHRWL